tara:strand:- start:402 stop:2300 length:1899 start_codon:yes stop_codon:yes gene_type:complete
MSYYNQIANQAQGFANYNQQQGQRGQANINDFNIEKGEYTGAEVAHRSGLQALQTGNEMPRLMEEYFGLKPAMKKVVPALLEKSGANAAFKSAIKGTKLEGYLNRAKTATENVKSAATAVKEGRYGDAADVMTGGKASEAAASVKKFGEDTLAHHTAAAKDAVNQGVGEAKNTIDGFAGKVRQLGSDTYKGLSADAKAALPKGAIDEHGIPLNTSELSRTDTYKGLTTGRMKANDDGTITDTLNDSAAVKAPGVGGEGLPGGGRFNIDNSGQVSFKTEGGEPYGAGAASDGSARMGSSSAYDAQKEASLGRDFQGTPQTQSTLDNITAAKDAQTGSVDFGKSTGRVEDPAQLSERAAGKRAIKEPDAAPRASAEDVAEARIPKITTRPGQNVRVRGDPATDPAPVPSAPASEGAAAPSPNLDRIRQKIRDNQSAQQPAEGAGAEGTSAEQAAARTTTTEGGYADQLAPMRELGGKSVGAGEGAEGRLASEANTVKPNLPQYLKGRQAPTVEAKPAELPTSSSNFATKGTPAAENLGKEEAVKGAETLGKTVAETEGELVPAEAAEAALPGVGEVLMGLTAAAGLVRGAIKEHREKKAMEADAPVAPQAPTQQASGIAFSSAPVIDSSDYHHL